MLVSTKDVEHQLYFYPDNLYECFEKELITNDSSVILTSLDTEHEVLIKNLLMEKSSLALLLRIKMEIQRPYLLLKLLKVRPFLIIEVNIYPVYHVK